MVQLRALAPVSTRPSKDCFKQMFGHQKPQRIGGDPAAREGALSLVAYQGEFRDWQERDTAD